MQLQNSVVLADFQSPEQVQWFRVVGPDGTPGSRPQATIASAPDATASSERCLTAALSAPDDTLFFDLSGRPQPRLPGDWRDFGVLLFSVYGPAEGAELTFSLSAGAPDAEAWTQTIDVASGWNHVRIDLDEIRHRVDLALVRTLAWRLTSGNGPAVLYLADPVLANRTVWQLGRDPQPGQLYAFSRGLRLFVGARDRFELAFADGVIVGWYADGRDNLTVPTGLGPWAVALGDGSHPQDVSAQIGYPATSSAPADAGVRQKLDEASAFRVVVEGGPVTGIARAPPADTDPHYIGPGTWRYVVYADGRVFVRVRREGRGPAVPADRLGYALRLNPQAGYRAVSPPSAEPGREPAPFMLLARTGAQRADLFWTCAARDLMAHRRAIPPERDDPLVLLVGETADAATVESAHLLRFWPRDLEDAAQAEPLAADYQNPVALRPSAGRIVTDVAGDLNHDGFNEAEGCYEIALYRGVARFTFDPGDVPRSDPVFRVHGSEGRHSWVYADGQALPADQRDAAGRLLFMLPGVIRTPRAIEIHTQ